MGRLLLIASILLAGCGSEAADPVQQGKDAPVVGDAKVFRAELEIRNLEAELSRYAAVNGDWPKDWLTLKRSAVDPWGRTYLFDVEDGVPVVWSLGPDGKEGTDDDVYTG